MVTASVAIGGKLTVPIIIVGFGFSPLAGLEPGSDSKVRRPDLRLVKRQTQGVDVVVCRDVSVPTVVAHTTEDVGELAGVTKPDENDTALLELSIVDRGG